MNSTDYQQKARKLENDSSTYVKVSKDPTKKYKEQLKKIVKRLLDEDNITKAQNYLLFHLRSLCPDFMVCRRITNNHALSDPMCLQLVL